MSTMKKLIGLGAGLAAIAAAAPVGAQYYSYPYSYAQTNRYAQPYGYAQTYGYAQPYAANTSVVASQCTSAVQSRLYNRTSVGGILGVVLGASVPSGRVLSITEVKARNNGLLRVRGLASSGRYASNGYGPYGVGAYGALGYSYANAADLSFPCDVAPNGAVYSVSIKRR
jgi:hypothetical protein